MAKQDTDQGSRPQGWPSLDEADRALANLDRLLSADELKSELMLKHARSNGFAHVVRELKLTEADITGLPVTSEQYWLEERACQEENLADLARANAEGDAAAKRYIMSVFSSILLLGMCLIILIGAFSLAM